MRNTRGPAAGPYRRATIRYDRDPHDHGLVSNVSPARPKLTNTNMTNGIVSAEKGDATGLTLTVTYDGGGKSFRITVPSNAPIVRYVLADRSAAAVGSAVMIKTNPGDQADLVTVGKGVMPPM